MTTDDHRNTFGIDPAKIYRRYSEEAEKIIGLKRSAIDDGIKNGSIPKPLLLTEQGRATGWLGVTLIELQRKRMAMAEARRAPAAAAETESPRPTRRGRRR
jgi:predicted DNA-binding transcriptional regulator AlpA